MILGFSQLTRIICGDYLISIVSYQMWNCDSADFFARICFVAIAQELYQNACFMSSIFFSRFISPNEFFIHFLTKKSVEKALNTKNNRGDESICSSNLFIKNCGKLLLKMWIIRLFLLKCAKNREKYAIN